MNMITGINDKGLGGVTVLGPLAWVEPEVSQCWDHGHSLNPIASGRLRNHSGRVRRS